MEVDSSPLSADKYCSPVYLPNNDLILGLLSYKRIHIFLQITQLPLIESRSVPGQDLLGLLQKKKPDISDKTKDNLTPQESRKDA